MCIALYKSSLTYQILISKSFGAWLCDRGAPMREAPSEVRVGPHSCVATRRAVAHCTSFTCKTLQRTSIAFDLDTINSNPSARTQIHVTTHLKNFQHYTPSRLLTFSRLVGAPLKNLLRIICHNPHALLRRMAAHIPHADVSFKHFPSNALAAGTHEHRTTTTTLTWVYSRSNAPGRRTCPS